MISFARFRKVLQQIQVVRTPKRRLSTFGNSKIDYYLVTDVPGLPDRSKLRMGQVTAERPAIITHQTLKDRFSGFGDESLEYVNWLTSHFGEALKGLEYNFKNEPTTTKIELITPDLLTQKLLTELDKESTSPYTLLKSSDQLWELSIMKFIVEETLASFAGNYQELRDRGFFESEPRSRGGKEHEIQMLFDRARTDRTLIPVLGKKLKDYSLFEKFQDAFFDLLKP